MMGIDDEDDNVNINIPNIVSSSTSNPSSPSSTNINSGKSNTFCDANKKCEQNNKS